MENTIYISTTSAFAASINFIEHSLTGKLPQANYVIGAACGASEIAMPLAGITGAGLGFIRKSKRREDKSAKIIAEHKPSLVNSVTKRNVFCVEDYVCSGTSLRSIMNMVEKYSPKEVIGLSVNLAKDDYFQLKTEVDERKFRVYS